ncbi:MAG TPA: FimV/HubP family polar landmark protein [Steroidobacteraceae bacterium]|jgi:pilus assembly protein FimV
MVAKRSSLALALLLVLPSAGFALSLGDIRLLSSLNSPLDAEIDLADVTPDEHQTLKAQIAPRDVFARNGLDYPAFLANVQVRTVKKPDGKEVVKLTSSDPITEPFVTVLVEVDYARGRFVREYTMLLDPPVYTPNQSVAGNAPVAAPTAGGGARGGEIARAPTPAAPPVRSASAPAPTPSAAPAPASAPASASGSSDSTHLVRRGETLSQIASAAAGAGSNSGQTRSWMLAIYEANPQAFDQNMNLLRSGAVLRMPDAASVASVPASQASAEIRKQYAAWRGTAAPAGSAGSTEPGHLKLVTPTESGSAAGPASADAGQVKNLQGRVHDLEGQLNESKRLLEMRNQELADLQSKLAAKQGSAAAPAPAAQPPAAVAPAPEAKTPPAVAQATPPAAEPTPAPTPAPTAEEPASQAQPAPAPEATPALAAAPKKPVHIAPETPVESGGILDLVTEYWWALAALVVLILGYFGFKTMRSRRQSEFDDSLGRLASAGAESVSARGFATGETPPMRSGAVAAAASEDAFLVEESGTHERPAFPGAPAAPAAARHVSTDETISSDTAINLDQGDPLAEADFHMAYGLYDQAADLIRIAISREPARRDLKLKLLEVFFVWGNKDQFLQMARELASTREDAAPGEWEKIVIMGKQLAPEDPLFTAGGAVSGAADGGVDLDLEGGQSRVDFDLLGEPVPSEAGVDLDIGSALGDTNQQPMGTATDRNAAIDQSFSGSTATTRQMTQRIGRDDESMLADFGSDPEAPTVEQPAMSSADNPTIRQKVEIAMRQGSAEQTAELAIDDLGLDLGALDTIDQPGLGNSPDAPTLVAGLDDRSRRVMEEAQRRGGGDDKQSSTGTWHMDENELDAALAERGNGADNGHDPSATSRLAALSPRDVDYDLGEMNGSGGQHEHEHAANGNGLDLDVGTATVPDTAFTSTQKLSSDDLALPDLEPVTMSEVGTKLDLARAYMDMGDPDGARNILEEVMHEGSSTQKQEAQRLMESLPG